LTRAAPGRTLIIMVRSSAAAAVMLAACFSPTPPPGLPCTEDRMCPGDLMCDPATLLCVEEPGSADAPPGTSDAGTDAAGGDARVDAMTSPAWGAPIALTALNSTAADADPTMTADGLELFFSSSRTGTVGGFDIWVASRIDVNDPFTVVTRVAAVCSVVPDDSPAISADGLTLHFTSPRGTSGTHDVYIATRPTRTAAFTTPVIVAALSTDTDDELNVGLSEDQLVVIVDRLGPAGDRDLFQRTRSGPSQPWGAELRLTTANSPDTDASPGLDGSGEVLYFHSNRNGSNGFVLYRTERTQLGDTFSTPVPILELDVDGASDGNPFITPDEQTMVFDSNRPGGLGGLDLYMTTR
jgi:Tol biopolymer transport system component